MARSFDGEIMDVVCGRKTARIYDALCRLKRRKRNFMIRPVVSYVNRTAFDFSVVLSELKANETNCILCLESNIFNFWEKVYYLSGVDITVHSMLKYKLLSTRYNIV